MKNHWDECQKNYDFHLHECQKNFYLHESLPQLNFDKTLDKSFGNKNLEKNYFHKN